MKLLNRLAWLALILVGLIYGARVLSKDTYSDFDVYYRASELLRSGKAPQVYDLETVGSSPYRYAPIFHGVLYGIASLPHSTGLMLWFALQWIAFGLGFFLLGKVIKKNGWDQGWVSAVAILLSLRFVIDALWVGQVTGFVFLFLVISFAGFIANDGFRFSWVSIPAMLKLGPVSLCGLGILLPRREQLRSFLGVVSCLALLLGSAACFGALNTVLSDTQWLGWLKMLASDQKYFDSSHYGSQSLYSALLRLGKIETFSWVTPLASRLWREFALVGCLGTFIFWVCRKPKGAYGRGLFFGTGIFLILWFMPQTFKYWMSILILPWALLLVGSHDRFEKWVIVFSVFVLSLAGLDIVGSHLFFALQYASAPFLAIVGLGICTFRRAYRESIPSSVGYALGNRLGVVKPWHKVPEQNGTLSVSVIALMHDPRGAGISPERTLVWLSDRLNFLRKHFGNDFEFRVLVQAGHPSLEVMKEAEKREIELTVDVVHSPLFEQGGLRQKAFLASRGKWIVFSNPDQPVHLFFWEQAIDAMNSGCELVRGNRRIEGAQIVAQSKLLRVVAFRQSLSVLLNRAVQFLFGLESNDLHSGHVWMTRRFAWIAFAHQRSAGLLFDVEYSIVAKTHHVRQCDLPLQVFLYAEKPRGRVLSESLLFLCQLPAVWLRKFRGYYDHHQINAELTADDWGMSPAVNDGILYLAKRGIIKRVSMMANTRFCLHRLDELIAIPGVKLGLHLNLTFGTPLVSQIKWSGPGHALWDWCMDSLSKARLYRSEVIRETAAQLELLEANGVNVQYLDGHQHIHIIPGLLESIAPLLKEHSIERIRVPYDPRLWWSTKFVLNLFSWWLRHSPSLRSFEYRRVYYPGVGLFTDPSKLRKMTAKHGECEVIVHPASYADWDLFESHDEYTDPRVDEFHSLAMLEGAFTWPS